MLSTGPTTVWSWTGAGQQLIRPAMTVRYPVLLRGPPRMRPRPKANVWTTNVFVQNSLLWKQVSEIRGLVLNSNISTSLRRHHKPKTAKDGEAGNNFAHLAVWTAEVKELRNEQPTSLYITSSLPCCACITTQQTQTNCGRQLALPEVVLRTAMAYCTFLKTSTAWCWAMRLSATAHARHLHAVNTCLRYIHVWTQYI